MINREEILKAFEQIEKRIEVTENLLTTIVHQEKAARYRLIEQHKKNLLHQLAEIETNVDLKSYPERNPSSIRELAF
jgi:hypothetical protein